MRKWIKYGLDDTERGIRRLGIDDSFDEHSRHMDYYQADKAYESRESFFNKYFFGYHFGRLEHYDDFLRKHLSKCGDILSVASGRSANELFLIKDGWRITCSDLDIIKAYSETRKLFSDYEFVKLNILLEPAPRTYDSVMVLSLIYLFDNDQLKIFFENVTKSLKVGGELLLDSAGAPNNILTFFFNDIYLKVEIMLMRLARFLARRGCPALEIKHHGWRRNDREIVDIARRCGLELVAKENYAFLTEFRRSIVFNKFIKSGSWAERAFGSLGRNMPYVRMFKFQKVR